MNGTELLKEIKRLSIQDRVAIAEQTLRSIREEAFKSNFAKGVSTMMLDYTDNEDLTSFLCLDVDEFYETS